jgi:hypothetical protein
LALIAKEFNMYIAMVVRLGKTGGDEPLSQYRQMAVLLSPYGKPERACNCILQS